MKKLVLILFSVFIVGCSSTQERNKEFAKGAEDCKEICLGCPEISEFSVKAGGGVTLLFIGGMEYKCVCTRTKN